MLKIIHTSDWHLGKKLFKISRLPEQALFLDWLKQIIIKEEIDGLIIAGDIFDTPYPPAEALKIYFDFLQEITTQSNCQIFIIAGNHDSGRFLEAPNALLQGKKIHLVGQLTTQPKDYRFILENKQAATEIFLFPFFRSHELINLAGKDNDLLSAIERLLNDFLGGVSALPKILVAHHLFGQFESAGVEQPISLSGLDSIPLNLVAKFDYVALGHIHRPQKLAPHVIYSGSPLPYRFSEHPDKKIFQINIQKTTNPDVQISPIDVPVFRQITTLQTNRTDLESNLAKYLQNLPLRQLSNLLEMKIEIDQPEVGLADMIREKIRPFNCELLSLQLLLPQNDKIEIPQHNMTTPDIHQLFGLFYQKKYPQSEMIPLPVQEEFNELLDDLQNLNPSESFDETT